MDFKERQLFNAMQLEIDGWKQAGEKLVKEFYQTVDNYGDIVDAYDPLSAADLIALVNTPAGQIPVSDRDVMDYGEPETLIDMEDV